MSVCPANVLNLEVYIRRANQDLFLGRSNHETNIAALEEGQSTGVEKKLPTVHVPGARHMSQRAQSLSM
jgi:hypothetical protein